MASSPLSHARPLGLLLLHAQRFTPRQNAPRGSDAEFQGASDGAIGVGPFLQVSEVKPTNQLFFHFYGLLCSQEGP